MSLPDYFEQHEEQAFVAKALATAVAIILVRNYLSGLIDWLLLIFPVVFLIGIKLHAAATGADPMDLLREHITFFPMLRSEADRRTEVTPWVTYCIIFANVLIYYGFECNVSQDLITDNLIFLPREPNIVNVPLSAFTAIFLHAGSGHLWGNMMFLWVVGTAVERRVGRQRFWWLYLATGLIGGIVYILVEFLFFGRAGHALGASGAIAGIMGVFAVRCYFKTMIFPFPILGIFSLILPISLKIKLNSLVIMALFFLSDLSGGIEQVTGQSDSMIGHWAHLGGMISGMLIANYLKLGEDAVEERHLEIGIKAAAATTGFAGGEHSLQIALEHNPDNVDAVLAMARMKTKFRHTAEGKELYEKAMRLLLAQRPAEIVEVFREYVAKYQSVPPDPALVSRLAELSRKSGEIDLCLHCLEHFIEMPGAAPPAREKALYQAATLLEFTSSFEAARSMFARFAAEYPASVLAATARQKAGGEVYATTKVRQKIAVPVASPCPTCGAALVTRPVAAGPNQGKLFRVCSSYPACKTHLPIPEQDEIAAPAMPVKPAVLRYRLVFAGTIALSSDPEETKENLARLLRCDRQRIDQLCRGQRTVLKRDLDHATALRMKEAFDRTGAVCVMEEQRSEAETAQAPAAAATAAQAAPPPPQQDFACPKCGHLQEPGDACGRCGVVFAKLAARAEQESQSFLDHLPGGVANPVMSEAHERRWAMCCHLMVFSGVVIPFGNVLGPLAIWLWKRKESDFIDYHGKTALNYQLTLLLFLIGCTIVAAFTGFAPLFVGPLYGLLALYSLVMIIMAVIKSYRGDYVVIAMSAEFIK